MRDIHTAVALCGLSPRRAEGGIPVPATLGISEGQASVGGLMNCKNPCACPVCAPRLAAQRAAVLGPQISGLMRGGATAWLLTFTVSHERGNSLAAMSADIGRAWSRLSSGRWWHNTRAAGGVSYVRGLDATNGKNGWHLHIHCLVVLGPEHADPESVAFAIRDRWLTVCARLGLKVDPKGQDVQRARDEKEATAYAVTPAAVYETAAMAMKRTRGKGAGLTPFEILERAVAERSAREREATRRGVEIQEVAEGPWERLWREYVRSTKGLRQVTTSRDLTLSDDDLPADEETVPLAELGPSTLRTLDSQRRTTDLFEVAEEKAEPMDRLRAIEAFLTAHVCAPTGDWCDWQILWPPGSPEIARDLRIRAERIRRQDSEVPL